MGERWAVVLPGKAVWVLDSADLAQEFRDYVDAEVDPAWLLPVRDPAAELLAWRRTLEELPGPGGSTAEHAARLAGAVDDPALVARVNRNLAEAASAPTPPADGAVTIELSLACQQGRHHSCTGRRCSCPRHADQLAACAGSLLQIAQRRAGVSPLR